MEVPIESYLHVPVDNVILTFGHQAQSSGTLDPAHRAILATCLVLTTSREAMRTGINFSEGLSMVVLGLCLCRPKLSRLPFFSPLRSTPTRLSILQRTPFLRTESVFRALLKAHQRERNNSAMHAAIRDPKSPTGSLFPVMFV